jgi:hypothetical protein
MNKTKKGNKMTIKDKTVEITITKKYTYVIDGLSENEAWDIVNREEIRDAVAIEKEAETMGAHKPTWTSISACEYA